MVNTTVVPTCFSCLDSSDNPVDLKNFETGAFPVTLNPADYANVTIVDHQLIVNNFTDLSFIMDGAANMIGCVDTSSTIYTRTVTTLSKERCVMMTLISPVLTFSLHFKNLFTLHTHTHTHTHTLSLSLSLSPSPLSFTPPPRRSYSTPVIRSRRVLCGR